MQIFPEFTLFRYANPEKDEFSRRKIHYLNVILRVYKTLGESAKSLLAVLN